MGRFQSTVRTCAIQVNALSGLEIITINERFRNDNQSFWSILFYEEEPAMPSADSVEGSLRMGDKMTASHWSASDRDKRKQIVCLK